MVYYELTPQLRRLILESNLTPDEKTVLTSMNTISSANIINFYNRFHLTDSLLELMRMTKMVLENKNVEKNPKPKTKEFIVEMEHLRLVEKELEYQRLVKPKPVIGALYEVKFNEETYDPARAHREVKSHITTMFNILISVMSVVYAIWHWTGTSWNLHDSYRVLLCLFFGILILVAEVVVYVTYLSKIEAARVAERQKKEVKRVIKSRSLR